MLNRDEVLYLVHQDVWPEDLLGDEFIRVVERVLSKTERQILEHKVEGHPDSFIAKLFNMKEDTLERAIRVIKEKLRVGDRVRVDDWVRKTKNLFN